ncbi:SI1L3 protein, partial [Climacteris rufus]|nr:SI1L3 protein [Climacteris rufus]
MGVRARVAEWPPRPGMAPAGRDPSRAVPAASQPSLAAVPAFRALHRLARRRSKDVEFQEGWDPPGLRQRSSSEVTLSECDPDEAAEAG